MTYNRSDADVINDKSTPNRPLSYAAVMGSWMSGARMLVNDRAKPAYSSISDSRREKTSIERSSRRAGSTGLIGLADE